MSKKTSANPVSDRELDDMYAEMLDEVHGTVKVAGYEYETSRALRDLDPVAYRCGFADFISDLLEDRLTEIDGEYYWTDDVSDDDEVSND